MLSLWGKDFLCALLDGNIVIIDASNLVTNFKKVTYYGEMAEWSIASDLKSDELTGSVSSNLTLSFLISVVLFTFNYFTECFSSFATYF